MQLITGFIIGMSSTMNGTMETHVLPLRAPEVHLAQFFLYHFTIIVLLASSLIMLRETAVLSTLNLMIIPEQFCNSKQCWFTILEKIVID